jgi:hypothetical protein
MLSLINYRDCQDFYPTPMLDVEDMSTSLDANNSTLFADDTDNHDMHLPMDVDPSLEEEVYDEEEDFQQQFKADLNALVEQLELDCIDPANMTLSVEEGNNYNNNTTTVDPKEKDNATAPSMAVDAKEQEPCKHHHCTGVFCQATIDRHYPESFWMLDLDEEQRAYVEYLMMCHECAHIDQFPDSVHLKELEDTLYQRYNILCLPPSKEAPSRCGWLAFCSRPCAVKFAIKNFLVKSPSHHK